MSHLFHLICYTIIFIAIPSDTFALTAQASFSHQPSKTEFLPPHGEGSSRNRLGWQSPQLIGIGASAGGFGLMSATQMGNTAQNISFNAEGSNMGIVLDATHGTDASTMFVQSGSHANIFPEEITADTGPTYFESDVVPTSTLGMSVEGADSMTFSANSQAIGSENVNSEIFQHSDVFNVQTKPSGSGTGWSKQ